MADGRASRPGRGLALLVANGYYSGIPGLSKPAGADGAWADRALAVRASPPRAGVVLRVARPTAFDWSTLTPSTQSRASSRRGSFSGTPSASGSPSGSPPRDDSYRITTSPAALPQGPRRPRAHHPKLALLPLTPSPTAPPSPEPGDKAADAAAGGSGSSLLGLAAAALSRFFAPLASVVATAQALFQGAPFGAAAAVATAAAAPKAVAAPADPTWPVPLDEVAPPGAKPSAAGAPLMPPATGTVTRWMTIALVAAAAAALLWSGPPLASMQGALGPILNGPTFLSERS